MTNQLLKAVLFSLLLIGANHLFSQDVVVQVGAYNQKMPMSYFTDLGLSGVYETVDHNKIYRYYIGRYNSTSEAQETLEAAIASGCQFARIDDMSRYKSCSCSFTAPKRITSTPIVSIQDQIQSLKSIFFGFDSADLRLESKAELDKLYRILTENPNYSAELRAHTDSKGSLEYNTALSMRRAVAARSYLISKGVSGSRLITNTYGENAPIAKNEVEGADTELGRQLNRRVELLVKDPSGNVMNIVEEIQVPDYLKGN